MLDETIVETLPLTDEDKPLPEGWRLLRLCEVCELNPTRSSLAGKLKDRSDDTLTSFVQMSAVDERLGVIACPEVKPFGQIKRGYTIFAEDDVLFAKITPCMQNGKHAIARNLIDGFGFGSTEFHVLRPTEKIISSLLHSFLRQPSVLKAAIASFTGTVGQQRVPEHFIANLQIPLPPTIEEQRRIASILDEQMKAVEQARLAVEEQLSAANLLPNAFLRSIFESKEAQKWQKRKLGSLAKVQSGYAFKTEWYVKEGIRLLRNANVFQGYIDWSDVARLSEEARPKFVSYELNEGDIVLSLDRPLVSNGLKVARLTSDDVPSLLLQRVGRFLLSAGINSNFLYTFLNSDTFINSIKGHDQSLGVPHISPSQVENIEIPIPPTIEEQIKIAERLNEQMRAVETLKKSLTDKLEAVKKLPAALLRKAFAGEL